MPEIATITDPDDATMDTLCTRLLGWSDDWRGTNDWPADALQLCARAGVYRWFLPESSGGFGWSDADQTRGYLRLAASDLTTTFIITQYMGACRRIAGSENPQASAHWLQPLISGQGFGTVGISHLTTSRRHLGSPALAAEPTDGGFILNGFSPWVTGGIHADVIVVGAELPDGRQLLAAVPTRLDGVRPSSGIPLVALSASCTDRVDFENVHIDDSMLLAGPVADVMQSGTGAGTGGLQTSTLALGLAQAASEFLSTEAAGRDNLAAPAKELARACETLQSDLLRAASGDERCDVAAIRGRANKLVLQTTQAALTAAKGAGFVEGHRVGRWCREALFFLVWSCPQPVAQAHLCELAGLA